MMIRRIYDVSMEISPEMQVYKNKDAKRPHLSITADHPSHGVRETRISMDLHTGTHIDAPLHMVKGGATMAGYRVEEFVAPCHVLDLTGVEQGIGRKELVSQPLETGDFVLLKTRNSASEEFVSDFVFLAKDGAEYLASLGVKGVGIDALGIERNQPDHDTHRILFEQQVMIIEGLRLAQVPPGPYLLVAAPLRIKGVEASPARVLLLETS